MCTQIEGRPAAGSGSSWCALPGEGELGTYMQTRRTCMCAERQGEHCMQIGRACKCAESQGVHVCVHVCSNSRRACMCCMQFAESQGVHAYKYTYIHACMHTHIHAHTHTQHTHGFRLTIDRRLLLRATVVLSGYKSASLIAGVCDPTRKALDARKTMKLMTYRSSPRNRSRHF